MMYSLYLPYIVLLLSAWLLSVVIKAFLVRKKEGGFHIKKGFRNGGMPSSHTSTTVALTTYLLLGMFVELFFVSLLFTIIVISDAVKVRRTVGLQGEALNTLLDEKVGVVRGHTKKEVVAGAVLGFVVAVVTYLLFL